MNVNIQIPNRWTPFIVTPKNIGAVSNFTEKVKAALQNPLGTPPMDTLALKTKNIVVLCDDTTRQTPVDTMQTLVNTMQTNHATPVDTLHNDQKFFPDPLDFNLPT